MPISSALGSSALLPAGLGFRNKIINGDMRIAQRGTSAITASGAAQYPVDRWIASSGTTNSITFQQVADAPSGFTHSVRATSGATGSAYTASHYTFLTQRIEGFNCSDLAWGTASAKPITISFWVKVSANAVGTHSVAVENVTGTMNYVATYTVSSTSWEYKTIQINGPTSGTFATDNTTGFQINFTLGAGSNYDTTAGTWTSGKYSVSGAVDLGALSSATWQVTGVQLEQNYQPTPFEQRPIGVELQLCQRYYYRTNLNGATGAIAAQGFLISTSAGNLYMNNPVPMRAAPTSVDTTGAYQLSDGYSFGAVATAVGLVSGVSSETRAAIQVTTGSTGFTTGRQAFVYANNDSTFRMGISAEL